MGHGLFFVISTAGARLLRGSIRVTGRRESLQACRSSRREILRGRILQIGRAVCRDAVRGGVAKFVDRPRVGAAIEEGECGRSGQSD